MGVQVWEFGRVRKFWEEFMDIIFCFITHLSSPPGFVFIISEFLIYYT